MWVASKLSCTVGVMGYKAVELKNWLLCFGCSPEEFIVFVVNLDGWMANSSPPWSAYHYLMACPLIALDKSMGVLPIGIGEMLRRSIATLVMRAVGGQSKTACGSLQMCAGLEASIYGATHAKTQRQWERNVLETKGWVDNRTAKERTAAAGEVESSVGIAAVGGVVEVPEPPGERQTPEGSEGGLSDDLGTAMEGMDVGGD